ncbi:MAG: FecR family protein [Deltaproteobacteria bacterium]|nr:FecR family protein [Deltaproteobacteria bacterium]
MDARISMKLAVLLSLLLMAATSLWAANTYGEAEVEKGELLILRKGQRIKVDQNSGPTTVMEEDLLRVRNNSSVKLVSNEKATLTLGANAVFHVKPWERREDKGSARMLFGRFKASIKGLTGGERFNVKTATATIGVKGTDYRSSVGTQGETLIISEDHFPMLTGLTGPTRDVSPGMVSFAAQGIQATAPAPAPESVKLAFAASNLDAPPANSRMALIIPGQEGLVDAGIVTEKEIENAQEEKAEPVSIDESTGASPDVDTNIGDALDNLYQGNLKLKFGN